LVTSHESKMTKNVSNKIHLHYLQKIGSLSITLKDGQNVTLQIQNVIITEIPKYIYMLYNLRLSIIRQYLLTSLNVIPLYKLTSSSFRSDQ